MGAEPNFHELSADVALGTRNRSELSALDKQRIKKARSSLEKGAPQEVFEELHGSTLAQTGLELRKMVGKFGLGRDTDTDEKKRTTAEQDRYDETKTKLEQVLTFLEKGYDKLTPAERGALMKHLEHSILNSRNPAVRKHLKGLSEIERRAYLKEVVQSADYANHVRESLENVKRLKLSAEPGVVRAEGAIKVAESQWEGAKAQKPLSAEDLRRAKDIHALILAGNYPSGGQIKVISDAITQAEASLAQARADSLQNRVTLNDALSGVNGRQAQRQAMGVLNVFESQVQEAKSRISDLYRDLSAAVPTEAEATNMRHATLAQDVRVEGSVHASRSRLKESRVVHEERAEDREAEEMAIQGEIEGIFGNALERKIVGDLQSSLEYLQENEPKVKDEFTKETRKEILSHLETRWLKPVKKGWGVFRKRGRDYKLDSKQIRRDYDTILGPNGPTELTRVMLRRTRVKDGTRNRSLSTGEINELMKNEDFTKEMKSTLIEQVLSREFTLRKATPGAIHRIMSSWGREYIENALNTKSNYRAMVKDLAQTGDLSMNVDNPTFLTKFIKTAQERPHILIDAAQNQDEQDHIARKSAA